MTAAAIIDTSGDDHVTSAAVTTVTRSVATTRSTTAPVHRAGERRWAPRPDPADVHRWCTEFHRTRDPRLRCHIAEQHQWLVEVCARGLMRASEPLDDLLQVGQIGLLHAIDRFDPSFGVEFRTFASSTITGELRRHYRSTWRVRVPRRVQELHLAVRHETDRLTAELRRTPTVAELATALHTREVDVIEARSVSTQVVGLGSGPDPQPGVVGEPPSDDHDLDRAECAVDLDALLSTLTAQEREVLHLRFFEDLTQAQIGARLGLSQVGVSRLIRRSLVRLRVHAGGGLAVAVQE